jgi:glycolate oxidase FAD binding subunit
MAGFADWDSRGGVIDVLTVDSPAAVQEAVRNATRLQVRGGGSKTALSAPLPGAGLLDLSALSGMLEYEPGEFVFTALAGTPLRAIEAELARHGQYLPFNPPLAGQGATLGGTVAAGLSGAGRQRYGGLRDFLLGARFVDGRGRLIRSGGKVVKNAAGFDQHKLLIGSLGSLGVLVELSFKVFPQPPVFGTLRVDVASVAEGVALLRRLATTRFDLDALDLAADERGAAVYIRLGGPAGVLPQRLQMLAAWLGGGVIDDEAEPAFWRAGDSFGWLRRGCALVKVPVTLDKIAGLEAVLAAAGASRRYSSGGNLAWVGWPSNLTDFGAHLEALGLGGLVVLGATANPLIGVRNGVNLARRFKAVLDPNNKLRLLE